MRERDTNTEKVTLAAAEQVFLDKGYAGAKTTEIAKIAGVNHAMLHYYFRTKENLFNKVFEEKATLLANSFMSAFEDNCSLEDKIRTSIGRHFDFLVENPKLAMFIISEVLVNKERKEKFKRMIVPKLLALYANVQNAIDEEVKKGRIKQVSVVDVILNVVSLNVFTLIATQVVSEDECKSLMEGGMKEFLIHRRENNINVVIKSLGL